MSMKEIAELESTIEARQALKEWADNHNRAIKERQKDARVEVELEKVRGHRPFSVYETGGSYKLPGDSFERCQAYAMA
jgi:hypothetical protein